MINSATRDNIRRAREAYRLSVPVYLCLGNRDLTELNAANRWLAEAPEFFPDENTDYCLRFDHSIIHVMPNHGDDIPFYWNDRQEPHFLDRQVAGLDGALGSYPDAVHVCCTHSPVFGIPVEQTGFDEPVCSPPSLAT